MALKQLSDDQSGGLLIHGPFDPEEIRIGEVIKAKLTSQGESFKVRVFKFSPLGIELLLEDEKKLNKGDSVEVEVKIGDQISSFEGLVVDALYTFKNKLVVGVRFYLSQAQNLTIGDKRIAKRWICSNEFYPTGVAPDPARYNQFIYFKIQDISSNGFKISTSLRNKFLVKGMTLKSLVNFPMVSQLNINLRIENVRIENQDNKDMLVLGCTYAKDDKISETVANYLYQFSDCDSLTDLKDQGVNIKDTSSSVSFSFVKTKKEYDEVLSLRYESYKAANKVPEGVGPEYFADIFDTRSRIVVGKYKGSIVSTARIIFSERDDQLEHEKDIEWQDRFPRKDEIVEISRVCTRSDFRGTGLLLDMFRHISIVVAQSGRSWLVISSDSSRKELYKKMGFEDVGVSYNLKSLNNIEHHMLMANLPKSICGYGMNPIYWNVVWKDVAQYLENYDISNFSTGMLLRKTVYSALNPFVSLFIAKVKPQKANRLAENKKAA